MNKISTTGFFAVLMLSTIYLPAQSLVTPIDNSGSPLLPCANAASAESDFCITRGFQNRVGQCHAAVDIAHGGEEGAPILSIGNGIVVDRKTGYGGGFGNALLIRLTDFPVEHYALYAHMKDDSLLVGFHCTEGSNEGASCILDTDCHGGRCTGDLVVTGQAIGALGSTGFVTGPHLHFGIKTAPGFGRGYMNSCNEGKARRCSSAGSEHCVTDTDCQRCSSNVNQSCSEDGECGVGTCSVSLGSCSVVDDIDFYREPVDFISVDPLPPDGTDVIFSDDFNDNSIDPAKWTRAERFHVREQVGRMELTADVTDLYGILESAYFEIDPTKMLTIDRRVRLHYGNDRFIGVLNIFSETDFSRSFAVHYGNMTYRDGHDCPVVGFVLSRNRSNPHACNTSPEEISSAVAPVWNSWFQETIVYNPISGDISYRIDGIEELAWNVGPLPRSGSPTERIQLQFVPWGWWTGHEQFFDDLVVTSGPDAVTTP